VASTEESTCAPKTLGPVRITVPISVAFDLEKFERALASFAQIRSGSGASQGNFSAPTVRDFVVDPASLHVREVAIKA
jgi:hypothetical protein